MRLTCSFCKCNTVLYNSLRLNVRSNKIFVTYFSTTYTTSSSHTHTHAHPFPPMQKSPPGPLSLFKLLPPHHRALPPRQLVRNKDTTFLTLSSPPPLTIPARDQTIDAQTHAVYLQRSLSLSLSLSSILTSRDSDVSVFPETARAISSLPFPLLYLPVFARVTVHTCTGATINRSRRRQTDRQTRFFEAN